MIICVSANPAIDRRLRIKTLNTGKVNRVVKAQSFAGGKAAHVAIAARRLGAEKVVWIGFSGGANGAEIERQLADFDIKVVAIKTKSPTRINEEIIEENGRITEILEPGGEVSAEEIENFYDVCRKIFAQAKGNFQCVFSGSLPPNAPLNFYENLILAARENSGQTILDTSGEAFLQGLKASPDLVKPNAEEAEKALNMKIENIEAAQSAANFLLGLGAKNAAVSLGADGLVWADKNGLMILAKSPEVKVNSTVGCGDSTIAGFAVAAANEFDVEKKLRLAVACGAANCLADLPAHITIGDVERLMSQVEIKKIC